MLALQQNEKHPKVAIAAGGIVMNFPVVIELGQR